MRRIVVGLFFILLFAGISALSRVPTSETIAFMQSLVNFSNSGYAVVLATVVMVGGTAAGVARCGIMGAIVGIGFAAFIEYVPSLLLAAMLSAHPTANPTATTQIAHAPVATSPASASQQKSK